MLTLLYLTFVIVKQWILSTAETMRRTFFAIVRQSEVNVTEDIGAEDGSQFLNESGQGMEVENKAQTSHECDHDSETGGHPPSGEVY